MTFITGTLTNANPGPALYALIESVALADGWTLADTVVIGANTHKVLKSAAAGNAQNLDWFLDINFPTTGTSGGMRFAAFEGYDPATKLAVNGPYNLGASGNDPVTFSRFGTTGYALETNWLNTANNGVSNTLSTAAFIYWISITRNRIIVMLSTQAGNIHYAGFFTPTTAHAANAGSALFPLITAKLAPSAVSSPSSSSSNGNCSLTRMPRVASVSNWSSNSSTWATAFVSSIFGAGVIGVDGMSPSPLTGDTTIAPAPVLAGTVGTSVSQTIPSAFIGTLTDVGCASTATNSVRGDSVTVGTDTWCMCTHTSGATILFRAV